MKSGSIYDEVNYTIRITYVFTDIKQSPLMLM